MPNKTSSPIIAVDTREQRPYRFPSMETTTLRTGDYSIIGLEDRIAIERKSKTDAYGSIGAGRDRFECELVRMASLDYGPIVVESTLADLLVPPEFSKLNPRAAVNSLLAWSVKHGLFVFFAENRLIGQTLTRRLLEKFWRYHGAEAMTGGKVDA